MRETFDDLKGGLDEALLSQEEETESKREDPREAMLEVLLLLFEEDLGDALGGILVARATEDHTDGEGGNGLKLNTILTINDDW